MLPLAEYLAAPPPRLSLGAFPSPVESHPVLAQALGLRELLIKRDDLNGPQFGGNKLRALEWLLPAAGPAVVSIGGYGSTWCAALAILARRAGRLAFPALVPQPWTPTVAGILATSLAHGEVTLAGSNLGLPLALWRAWQNARRVGRPTWLPAGGATPLAVLGSVNGALEFVRQVEEMGVAPPDAVVLPVGSSGTAAGLLLGFGLAGWGTTVCGVRVADPWFANAPRVGHLVRGTTRLLRQHGCRAAVRLPPFRLITDQFGGGYGHPTDQGRAAERRLAEAGVAVDLTYGAKACAAIAGLAGSFPRLCFWHTFDRRLMTPALEHPLLERARANAESLWPHPKST